MFLGRLLALQGIETVVLEARTEPAAGRTMVAKTYVRLDADRRL